MFLSFSATQQKKKRWKNQISNPLSSSFNKTWIHNLLDFLCNIWELTEKEKEVRFEGLNSFIHSTNLFWSPALDAGKNNNNNNNTLSCTLSYNEDSSLAGKIISYSFWRSISNLYWKNNLERRTYMQVSPFSPDCTRLDHSLLIKFQVKPGSRKLTCKDLVTLKLL